VPQGVPALLCVLSGLVSFLLLARHRCLAVRLTAAFAVTGLLWGWGLGQQPVLLPGTTNDRRRGCRLAAR
jgi:cytochrome bd ubiquinol oxidase subunit II